MRLTKFTARLDRLSYPTTTAAVLDQFGTTELHLPAGAERVDRILNRTATETFHSADDLRLTLYGALPTAAIGRPGYSDRDPPGVDEVDPLSF